MVLVTKSTLLLCLVLVTGGLWYCIGDKEYYVVVFDRRSYGIGDKEYSVVVLTGGLWYW